MEIRPTKKFNRETEGIERIISEMLRKIGIDPNQVICSIINGRSRPLKNGKEINLTNDAEEKNVLVMVKYGKDPNNTICCRLSFWEGADSGINLFEAIKNFLDNGETLKKEEKIEEPVTAIVVEKQPPEQPFEKSPEKKMEKTVLTETQQPSEKTAEKIYDPTSFATFFFELMEKFKRKNTLKQPEITNHIREAFKVSDPTDVAHIMKVVLNERRGLLEKVGGEKGGKAHFLMHWERIKEYVDNPVLFDEKCKSAPSKVTKKPAPLPSPNNPDEESPNHDESADGKRSGDSIERLIIEHTNKKEESLKRISEIDQERSTLEEKLRKISSEFEEKLKKLSQERSGLEDIVNKERELLKQLEVTKAMIDRLKS